MNQAVPLKLARSKSAVPVKLALINKASPVKLAPSNVVAEGSGQPVRSRAWRQARVRSSWAIGAVLDIGGGGIGHAQIGAPNVGDGLALAGVALGETFQGVQPRQPNRRLLRPKLGLLGL